LAKYLRAPTKEARPCPYPYYPITQVLESIFLSVFLGGTIAFKRPIGLSMEGLRNSRLIHTHVLSDMLPLEGVPTGVTRVANRCALKYLLYFMRADRGFMHVTTYLCSFKMPEYVSMLKNLTHNFLSRKVL